MSDESITITRTVRKTGASTYITLPPYLYCQPGDLIEIKINKIHTPVRK